MSPSFLKRILLGAAGSAVLLAGAVANLQASTITDPAGDFLPSYTGPTNGDLDVLSAEVTFNGPNFLFTSTLNGAVGTTAGGFYVWGVNRGAGTAGFPTIAPGVLFDSVVILRPDGTGTVRDFIGGTTTNLTDVVVSGDTISAIVPVAALPSEGFDPSKFTVNLWPRSGAGGNEVISDFAPDNSNAPVTNATPEPGTLTLAGAALAALALRKLRRA